MKGAVIPFLRPRNEPRDWSQAELAEFYRVEASLIATGMRVDTDRGMTDEGDPWFVFCHVDDDQDVIIHFARIGSSYLVSAPGMGGVISGDDFRELVRRLLTRHEAVAAHGARNDNVVLHPAAMLWVLVAIAFLQAGEARAHGGAARQAEPSLLLPATDARTTQAHDPVAALSAYALQPIMGAWGSSLGVLAAVELHPGTALNMSDSGPETPADRGLAIAGPDAGPTAASRPDQPGPETTLAPETHAPSGSGTAPVVAVEALALPVVAEHGVDKAAAFVLKASSDPGSHGAPEASVQQAALEGVLPVPATAKEATYVLAAVDAATNHASATVALAVPDALAGVLHQALHLTGDSADAAAKAAALQVASTTASISAHADTAIATHDTTDTATIPVATTAVAAAPIATPVTATPADTATSPAVSATAAAAPTAAPADLSPHPSPPPPTPAPVAEQQKVALATSALQAFVLEVPGATTTTYTPYGSPHTVVVAADPVHAHDTAALTFDFNDGTQISLIGLPTELASVLALAMFH